MTHLLRTVGACLGFFCLPIFLSVFSNSQADEPELTPHPGVLVLRGGRVLSGDITRVGDRYVVMLGKQDEVGVPVQSVEMRCDTLEQAYQRKRDALPPHSTAAAHLELGDWCLRYEIIPAAAEQLMAAQNLDPDHPANAVFERRLRLAAHRPQTSANSSQGPSQAVTQAALDQLFQDMPSGTVKYFTNAIQPLLLNRCGRCHGSNSKLSFRLLRPDKGHALPRRFTQRNLHAAMSFVDKEHAHRSPLLIMSTNAHGDAKKPVFSEKDVAQVGQLTEWVLRIAGKPPISQPAAIGSRPSILQQPDDRSTSAFPETSNGDALKPGLTQNRSTPRSDPGATTRSADRAAADSRLPGSNSVHSSDPFDPEIFNRRYLKRQP